MDGGGNKASAAAGFSREEEWLPAVRRRRQGFAQGAYRGADADDRWSAKQIAPEFLSKSLARGKKNTAA
jgi:hypothetical protein